MRIFRIACLITLTVLTTGARLHAGEDYKARCTRVWSDRYTPSFIESLAKQRGEALVSNATAANISAALRTRLSVSCPSLMLTGETDALKDACTAVCKSVQPSGKCLSFCGDLNIDVLSTAACCSNAALRYLNFKAEEVQRRVRKQKSDIKLPELPENCSKANRRPMYDACVEEQAARLTKREKGDAAPADETGTD